MPAFAPRTRKALKESFLGAIAGDLAAGVKGLAHQIDEVTDPATEPVSHFVDDRMDNFRARRELRRRLKEQLLNEQAPLLKNNQA